ncbi:MAG: hypothetical protein EB039_08295 [Proteobacteria bacterium]|nr:hypothetical protein [Pseudomonadota bacterium]
MVVVHVAESAVQQAIRDHRNRFQGQFVVILRVIQTMPTTLFLDDGITVLVYIDVSDEQDLGRIWTNTPA